HRHGVQPDRGRSPRPPRPDAAMSDAGRGRTPYPPNPPPRGYPAPNRRGKGERYAPPDASPPPTLGREPSGGRPGVGALPTTPPLLHVQDLRVTFFTPSGPVDVLQGVNLSIHPDEILGIVGESGSGKSVTALSIVRLLRRP